MRDAGAAQLRARAASTVRLLNVCASVEQQVDALLALIKHVDADARRETWLAAFDIAREQYETGGDPIKRLARVDKTLGERAEEARRG